MRHVERKDGKVVAVYENPQSHMDGKPRTEAVADDHPEVVAFFAEIEARSEAAVRNAVATGRAKK